MVSLVVVAKDALALLERVIGPFFDALQAPEIYILVEIVASVILVCRIQGLLAQLVVEHHHVAALLASVDFGDAVVDVVVVVADV